MAEVAFNGVTKRYPNGFQAVTDLNLEINDGEFLVMVGPSGCGKSTTLRMIAGLETISDGELLIDGKRVNDVDPGQRDIAMVFQNYALYPQMTVEENIGFGLKVRKMPKPEIKQRVAEAARILQLTEMLDRKPGQLSGGQRQRVAMGRAIVRRPKVFLLDEPLSNLDAKLRVQTRGEISRIQRELGVTTFYVTHDQVEAMTMGDRVAVIKDGVLLQVDTPTNLYNHPANVFVAAFIGSPSMNLMEAELIDDRTLQLGSNRLDIGAAFERSPELRDYVGRRLAVGIRPEALEDAELSKDDHVAIMEVPVSEVEALGPETIVYVTVDAPAVDAEDPDVNAEEQVQLEEGTTRVSCRFNPRTQVQVGDTARVAVTTTDLHFFDLESKLAIGNPKPDTLASAASGERF